MDDLRGSSRKVGFTQADPEVVLANQRAPPRVSADRKRELFSFDLGVARRTSVTRGSSHKPNIAPGWQRRRSSTDPGGRFA
jgi:hypothetical protein